jgi:hypothetical protein
MNLLGMEPRELRPKEIRHFVHNALIGFEARQLERNALRAQRQKANRKRTSKPKNGVKEMKSTIVFRAEFQQPRRTTFQLKASVPVEVYHSKVGPPAQWSARTPDGKVEFTTITPQSTPRTLMGQIETVHFERQITPWRALDISKSPPRLLESEDWMTDPKGAVFTTERYKEKLEAEPQTEAQKKISEMKAKALEGM